MLVNGNLGTGVAVAGAFSLVRFRSSPGTAKEILNIFTALAAGLAAGVGYIGVALIFVLTVCAAEALYTLTGFGEKQRTERELKITVPEDLNYTEIFDDLFKKYTAFYQLKKVKTAGLGSLYQLTYSVRLKDTALEKEFIDGAYAAATEILKLCAITAPPQTRSCRIMKKAYAFIAVILSVLLLSSCGKKNTASVITSSGGKADTSISTDNMDFDFSNKDTEYDYDESEATVIKESEDAVKITAAGTYVITGRHSSITVSAPDSAKVRIILKNATVQNSSGPAIYITAADKVFITAYKGTVNTVSDGSTYSSDFDGTNVDGAVFSKAELTLNGEGTLNVTGSYKCAVVSKDDLIICGLTLNAKSLGSTIEGKDCVKSKDATVIVTSGGERNKINKQRGYRSRICLYRIGSL